MNMLLEFNDSDLVLRQLTNPLYGLHAVHNATYLLGWLDSLMHGHVATLPKQQVLS